MQSVHLAVFVQYGKLKGTMWNLQGDSPHGALLPVTAFTFEAPRMGNFLLGFYSNISSSLSSDCPQDGKALTPGHDNCFLA